MIKHFIIIASAYSIGKRIALDYFDEKILQLDVIQKEINYINEKCGSDVPIATHVLQTDSTDWRSVVKKDKFFKEVYLVKNKEEFVKLLLSDRELVGIDIAKYILSIKPCTHLKLEKLTYLCYANYLCKEKDKLFIDKIFAYKLGPVIETVYDKYQKKGMTILEDNIEIFDESARELSISSRILSSKDGAKKLLSIEETLKKYGDMEALKLVKLTHKRKSPWRYAGAGKKSYEEITDDMVLNFHKNECS